VAAAIVFAGLCQRYEVHEGAQNSVLRLDRLTGRTDTCFRIPEDIAKDYKAGWCGTLAPPEPMN